MIFRLLSRAVHFFVLTRRNLLNVIRLYVCLGELVSDERNYLIDSLKLWQIHLRVKTHRKIIELGSQGIYGFLREQ